MIKIENHLTKKRTVLAHSIFCKEDGCKNPIVTSDKPIPPGLAQVATGRTCSSCRKPTQEEQDFVDVLQSNKKFMDSFERATKAAFDEENQ
jgi:hypothetical protein